MKDVVNKFGYTPEMIAECEQIRQERLSERDFEGYLILFGSHELPEPFLRIEAELSDKDYWRMLRDVWIRSELIMPHLDQWLRWFGSKRSKREQFMTHHGHRVLRELPEQFSIWRGCSHREGWRGLSWTLSRQKAEKFVDIAANGRRQWLAGVPEGSPYLFTAKCRKRDVIAYLNGREEREIIVDPKHVFDVVEIPRAAS